jgi:outer membrane protein OmpA-like peptidoglycan-associated protein
MLGRFASRGRSDGDEAEKPFWISLADLMTALMVLFLVLMALNIAAVRTPGAVRDSEIAALVTLVRDLVQNEGNVALSSDGRSISFGDRARFGFNEWRLTEEGELAIRRFVPRLVKVANSPEGRKVIKHIVVEGFTDTTGSYLSNLHLSLMRSQSVLCAIAADTGEATLSPAELEDVRALFVVGGYSFNAAKSTPEESRRVELRMEFLDLGEVRSPMRSRGQPLGRCAIQ